MTEQAAVPAEGRGVPTRRRFNLPPLAGVLLCSLGALAATAFVPEHVGPAGALRYSGAVLSIALLMAGAGAGLRNPRALFRGESVIMFALVFWLLLDIVQGAYDLTFVDRSDVITALWSIGLFAAGLWLALYRKPWRLPSVLLRSAESEFSSGSLFLVAVTAFVLTMLKYAIPVGFDLVEMFWWLGRGRWGAPWGRGQFGGWDAFSDHLAYFGYLLPTLTVLIARRSGWLAPRTITSLMMSSVAAVFLADGGGRRIIGVIFAAALVTYVLSATSIRARHFVVSVGTIAVLLWTLSWMLDYRNVGYRNAFSGEVSGSVGRGYYHVDDNFLRLTQIVHFIPDYQPFVYFQYLVWVAVRPVPRVFWPGKPVDPGFDLPQMLGMQGVSLSSSVIGELYASGGMIAVLLGGWIFGRLAASVNQLIETPRTASSVIILSISLLALFAGVRSMLDLILMSYPILAWIGLTSLFPRILKRRASA